MDRSFKAVLVFTLVYGVLGAVVFAKQPTLGRTQTADGFESIGLPQAYYSVQVASAEWSAL